MKAEKQYLLDDIEEKIAKAKGFVIAKYQHLAPNVSVKLREHLRSIGADIEVVKKRLLRKAAEKAGITFDEHALQGHIALLFSEKDPMPMTKAIFAFSKENEEILDVLCGRFEGCMYSGQEVAQIAELPEESVIRAQFLSVLEAPLASMLGVMESILCAVIHCLQNKLTKQQEV